MAFTLFHSHPGPSGPAVGAVWFSEGAPPGSPEDQGSIRIRAHAVLTSK